MKEYQWVPMHERPTNGWEFADHVPKGAPDPRDMRGHRLWMRTVRLSAPSPCDDAVSGHGPRHRARTL